MPSRSSKIVTVSLLALTLIGSATSAFADKNMYTRRHFAHPRHEMHHMNHMRMHRMHMMHRHHAM